MTLTFLEFLLFCFCFFFMVPSTWSADQWRGGWRRPANGRSSISGVPLTDAQRRRRRPPSASSSLNYRPSFFIILSPPPLYLYYHRDRFLLDLIGFWFAFRVLFLFFLFFVFFWGEDSHLSSLCGFSRNRSYSACLPGGVATLRRGMRRPIHRSLWCAVRTGIELRRWTTTVSVVGLNVLNSLFFFSFFSPFCFFFVRRVVGGALASVGASHKKDATNHGPPFASYKEDAIPCAFSWRDQSIASYRVLPVRRYSSPRFASFETDATNHDRVSPCPLWASSETHNESPELLKMMPWWSLRESIQFRVNDSYTVLW